MNFTRKSIVALACAAILALALFGCTSSDQGSGGSGGQSGSAAADAGAYVDTAWLQENLDSVAIVDARDAETFATGHIPGAVNLHWTALSNVAVPQGDKGWGELLDAATIATTLDAMGVSGDETIVVYTNPLDGWGEDGRIAWTLRESGFGDVHILDGGWAAWTKAGGQTTDPVSVTDQDPIDQVDGDYVSSHKESIVLVDARAPEEYNGEITMGEVRTGRIPGAVSVPYVSLINEDGTIKPADELQKIFADAGLAPDQEIVVYCTGGVRAAAVAELLADNGYGNVKVYAAGYSEWAGDDTKEVES